MIAREKIEAVLTRFEGKRATEAYIPCRYMGGLSGITANYVGGDDADRYSPLGVSGVTIATGIDLGQATGDALTGMGVPPELVAKLKPFLGKKGRTAVYALYQSGGFCITAAEAELLDERMHSHYIALVEARYDRDRKGRPFAELPWQAQAVIVSLLYQRGVNSTNRYPKTWAALCREDWADAAARLKNPRLWQGYQTRRKGEGQILEELV